MGRLTKGWIRKGGALLGGALLGCGSGSDGEGPYARRVAEDIPKIEKATGLAFKTPPRVESQPRDSVRMFLERRFREELPESELSGMERSYKAFGLIPTSMDLTKFMLDLLTEQVAGYYDPKAKTLYVVEGGDDAVTVITISHELVHALQDQHFNLDSLTQARDDNDRLTTGQSVVEGQATLEQIGAMIGSDNAITAMPGGWDRVRQMIRDQQGSMPVFASAPTILQETLIFPYLTGAEFMRRFKQEAPGQSPAADQRQHRLAMEGAEESEQDALASVVSLERKWGVYDFDWAEQDASELARRILAFEQERERRNELITWAEYRTGGGSGDAVAADAGERPAPELSSGAKALSLLLVVLLIALILIAVWAL
jgi:hypothetical protein